MSLFIKLQADRKTAFKAREKTKKDVLNFVVAQIKNKQIDERRDLSDDEIIKIIKKEIKAINEAIGFLETSGKTDEIALEREKISYLEVYLPQMLSADELREILIATVRELAIAEPMKNR
jgi:uncharacterized protein YqeY